MILGYSAPRLLASQGTAPAAAVSCALQLECATRRLHANQ